MTYRIFITDKSLVGSGYIPYTFGIGKFTNNGLVNIPFNDVHVSQITAAKVNYKAIMIAAGNKLFYLLSKHPHVVSLSYYGGINNYHQKFAQIDFGKKIEDICITTDTTMINTEGILWIAKNVTIDESMKRTDIYTFKLLPLNHKVIKISCGLKHYIIMSDVGLFGSGNNSCGQLGLGHTDKIEGFHKIDNLDINIKDICCGTFFTMVCSDDVLLAFGHNFCGQLGIDPSEKNINITIATRVSIDGEILQIACGITHSVVLTTEGLFGTGNNFKNMLGLGAIRGTHKMTKIPFGNPITGVEICSNVTIIYSENDLYVCGENVEEIFGTRADGIQRVLLEEKFIAPNIYTRRFKSTKRAN